MMFGDENIIIAENPFCEAYNKLSQIDKRRFRFLVLPTCGISENCLYEWLRYPERIKSYNDKFYIATLLNKNVQDLFPKPKTEKL